MTFRQIWFAQLSDGGLRENHEAIRRCAPSEVREHPADFREWTSLMEDEMARRGISFDPIDLKALAARA